MLQTVQTTLGSAVADSGTFNVSYPSGTNKGTFYGGIGHRMSVAKVAYAAPVGFTVTLNATNVTITNNSGATWAAGAAINLELQIPGEHLSYLDSGQAKRAVPCGQMINLGAPITADADGVSASQDVVVATTPLALINGALASGGAVTLDVPRNIVGAWTGAAVVTVTGTDEYGEAMVEASASGTSFTGKKAFKTVTRVSFSANVTSATVGTGVVLGLPVFLPGLGYVVKELMDGAVATAGTVVAGIVAKQTATTGDIRGTYVGNSAPDGARVYQLVVALQDTIARGTAQYAG